MKMFKTTKSKKTVHMIDDGGNHLIADSIYGVFKCVNPMGWEAEKVGSTLPKEEDRIYLKKVQKI